MSTEHGAPQRPSSWLSNAFALVGVFLFLGGLALFITQLREGIAAPPAPIETTYAALPEHVLAGATWVRITDAVESCMTAPWQTNETSLVYKVVSAEGQAPSVLTESDDARPCSEEAHALVGVARLQETPAELAIDAREVVILRPDEDPRLSYSGLALVLAFSMMGLVLAFFYAAAARVPLQVIRLRAQRLRPALPGLPKRPLRLAKAYRSSLALALSFMSAAALMFAAMTASQWPEEGFAALNGGLIAMLAFTSVMTLAFVLLTAAVVRGSLRQARGVDEAREAWAPLLDLRVLHARGVDVGNRLVAYPSPFEEERNIEVSLGANESMPWVCEGHVLVVRDAKGSVEYVVREDGGPFELSDAECAHLMEGGATEL